MAAENTVDDKTVETDNEIETGIDTRADVEEGSDLDNKLDALAGIKKDAPRTPQTNTKSQAAEQQTTDANGKRPGEEGSVAPRDNAQGNRQNGERTYQPRSYPKAYASDSKGNVILKSTGEIIATAGGGRNAFERMLPLITSASGEAERYKNMYESAQSANAVATNLKLSPEEYSIGARIMAAYKSDPKKAVAFLISEAQNNGLDMSDLGVSGGGGGASVAAIEAVLETKINKALERFDFITADRQQQEDDRESMLQATRSTDEFLTAYPDAEVHSDSIAKIMNSKPGEIDVEKAYWILNSHANKLGLDWTMPLVPQIREKLNRTPNNYQPANTGRPLPELNGRPHNDSVIERAPRVMGGMSSSSDIVKEAMREAGMNVE